MNLTKQDRTKFATISLIMSCFFVLGIKNTQAYTAPIGIPEPSFGIEQVYTMYTGQRFDFDGDAILEEGEEYRDAGNGPYTHYVDSSSLSSTDTNNAYGSPVLPRKTVPGLLTAGAVVEVHNNANANGWGEFGIGGVGTLEKPIFVRGINNPRIISTFDIGYYRNAQYIIVEGFDFFGGSIIGRQEGNVFTTSFISVRNCDIYGDMTSGGVGISSWSSNLVNNIVIYNNIIHDNGEWDPLTAVGDQDNHGVGVGAKVSYLWVLDNEMYHNSGDGLQINAGTALQSTTHHIYVGRNISHHNKQSGMWTKQSVDVIFSENTIYGHRNSSSSSGTGTGFQYGPERVWFLYNHIYDNEGGIGLGSNSGVGFGTEAYFVGNLIHDIHYDPIYHDDSYDAYNNNIGSAWNNAAMMMAGGVNRYIVNNTIYDVDAGINIPASGSAYIANNIIANVNSGGESHIWAELGTSLAGGTFNLGVFNNLLYQPSGSVRIRDYNTIYSPSTLPVLLGADNLQADPLFVNPELSDFSLQFNSSARDTGVIVDVYQTFQDLYSLDIKLDKNSISRPQGSTWDIGAYEYQMFIRGDVDNSSITNTTDALLTLRNSIGLSMSSTAWQDTITTGDVDCNGISNSTDALLILRYSLGLDMGSTAWCE